MCSAARSLKVSLVMAPMLIKRCPLLGIGYLTSYLQARGHVVKVLDLNVMQDLPHADEEAPWSSALFVERFFSEHPSVINNWLDAILHDDPDVVAFSLWSSTVETSLKLAEAICARGADPLIVMGGPHAGFTAEVLIRHPGVDAVVIGEGEETFAALLDQYAFDRRVIGIPGALVKTQEGVQVGEERPEIALLDSIPFPDFSQFDIKSYNRPDVLPLSFNRGCIRRCTFCNIYESWKTYRHRSARNIFEEMRHQFERHAGLRHFEVDVAALNLNLKEIEALADLILADGLKVTWAGSALFRPDMDLRLLKKLAKAGLNRMDVGFESGSPKVLRLMLKGYRPEHAEKILRDCREAGIEVLLNVIVGFPGETEDDYQMTKDFLLRNRAFIAGTGPASELYVGYNNAIAKDPAKFGVDPESLAPINGAQLADEWRSLDGENDQALRRKRAEDFTRWAVENGLSIASNDVSRAASPC